MKNFDFGVPVEFNGDACDRCLVKIEEIRQSLRIIEQCLNNMPMGAYKADPLKLSHPKDRTLNDIETLINHFISSIVGSCYARRRVLLMVEAVKGVPTIILRLIAQP